MTTIPLTVTQAGPNDAPLFAALAKAAYAYALALMNAAPQPYAADYAALLGSHEGWIARDDRGALAGTLVLRQEADHLLLWSIAIPPDRQHQGLGRQLLAWCEDEARRRGLGEIRLYTNQKMERNQRLYARFGFVETARVPAGERGTVVHMAKRL